MNVVALIGNVASEPETTYSKDKACTRFRIAISRPGGEYADFFDVVTYDRQAEICKEYISVGRRVAIEGRMRQTIVERVEIVANRVQLLGRVATETA